MSKLSKLIVGVCLALLVAAGIWALAPRPAGSPELEIAESLQEAGSAAQAGDVVRLMEVVSDDFKAGMMNKARLRILLMRARSGGRGVSYDVRVTPPRVLPDANGDPNRRLVFTSAAVLGEGDETLWGGNQLTLVMRKETQRYHVLFTVPRWRILSIANLPPLPLEGAE